MIRHLNEFLDRYYALRGWTADGVPSPQKLHDLGLDFVAKEMP